jgi:hypothetical protein
MRLVFIAVIAGLALPSCKHGGSADAKASRAAAAEPQGIAAFTRHSRFVDAKISPNGTYLAAISVEGGRRSLGIIDLANRKIASAFKPEPQSVGNFYWANDTRVVVELWDEEGTLAAPVNYGEIYAVNATGGYGEMIFGYRAGKEREYARGAIIGRLRGDSRRVLIEAAYFGEVGDRIWRVYKLDVYNGRKLQVTVSPAPGAGFLTDENGEPRIAVAARTDAKLGYFYRDPDQGWTDLAQLKGITKSSEPVSFAAATRTIDVVERVGAAAQAPRRPRDRRGPRRRIRA